MKDLIFATGNAHKKQEVELILPPGKYHLLTLKDIGITEDIVEDGLTLEANASIKSKYVYERKGIDVFAEDTGLEVEALGGEPGVITARYAGEHRNDTDNMNYLLQKLEGKENRKARFRAVISLIKDGEEHLVEGFVYGKIAHEISEGGGFGYDPIFIPEGYEKTFAELPEEVKTHISHRANAINELLKLL